MNAYDILIVGGGLAGGSLALALEPLGLKVAVLEAVPEARRRSSPAADRALALAHGSIGIFEELDIWSRVYSRATPIREIHVSDRGHFGKTRLRAVEQGVDAFGYVLPAKDLEEAITTMGRGGKTESLCPAKVTELKVRGDRVEVGLVMEGRPMRCSARLVVAADGGNSQIRRWFGISQKVHDYEQTALVSTVESELPHRFTAYERFTSSGPLALLPLAGRRNALIWTRGRREAEAIGSFSSSRFENLLQKVFGWRLGCLKLVAPVRSFPLRLIQAERLFAERVALVGNAAHQLHPVAGQGFNLGLRDVMVLARLLGEQKRRGGDPGALTLLEKYARARVQDHFRTIGFCDALVRCFTRSAPPVMLIRNLGLIALDHWPRAKSWFARQAMGIASGF